MRFLTGWSPAAPLNFLTRRDGIEITRSIPYGEGKRRTLDVYRRRTAAPAPVVVFFHGGSWQGGSKASYLFVAAALARQGYAVVVPEYRVYPEVRYPDFLDDGARALRWAIDNATRFGGDPKKLFVMGHSAGAYIAAMLAFDRRWLGALDLVPDRDIAGLIGLSGPYDFLPLRDEILQVIFGGANQPATQPISHVSPGAPAALLLTGARDATVDHTNSTRLAARLRAAGGEATVIHYRWPGHLGILGAFAPPLRFLAPVLGDVEAFIAKRAASDDAIARHGSTQPRR